MMNNLGLGYSPESVTYLYIGEAEDDKGSTAWYQWNHDTSSAIPVHEDALTGVITNIMITNKPYKGANAYKLNIHIQADRRYVIQCGAGTVFARGFLLALRKGSAGVEKLSGKDVLTITAKKSDEGKAVFCGVFVEGSKIIPDWDGECQLLPVVQDLQRKMGFVVQTQELIDDKSKYYEEIKSIEKSPRWSRQLLKQSRPKSE